ncbi:MAG: SBBP repeat-containing protein, partial [Phycisphaerales bacterium]
MKTTSVAFLLLAFCSSSARGQTLEWIRQLGTSEYEESHGVSADGLGNVYMSGYTIRRPGDARGRDALLSKYDASGTLQWTQQLGTRFERDNAANVSADG